LAFASPKLLSVAAREFVAGTRLDAPLPTEGKRACSRCRLLGVMIAMPLRKDSSQFVTGDGDRAEPVEIWKARKLIRDHSDGELSLTEIAKSVNLSANYLSEKFKEVTGVNFVRYVGQTRTAKARDLLRNSNLRISEIAFAVGFQSLSQFNRVFKKLTRKSPTQFRAGQRTGKKTPPAKIRRVTAKGRRASSRRAPTE
jgi:AraC-like DNA-binding protein